MGNDLTRTDRPLCGVLVPDTRLEFWPEESANFDEASPFAGNPIENRSTGMILSSSGTPENLDTLEVRSQFGGFPGFNGAAFLYRQQISPAQDWRGWDSPSAVSFTEIPTWTTSTTSGRRHPAITSLKNGVTLVTADFPLISGSGLRRVVRRRRSAEGVWGNWSIQHTETGGGTSSFRMLFPKTIQREDETVECFHFTYDEEFSLGQVSKRVSTDNGVSFELAQARSLIPAITLGTSVTSEYEPEGLHVAYANGQHLMILELRQGSTGTRFLRQYASRDGGNNFEVIGEDIEGQQADLVSVGGFFIMSYNESSVVYTRRVGSAFNKLSDEDAVTALAFGDWTALAASDNNEVYVLTYYVATNSAILTRSLDYGGTWEAQTGGFFSSPFDFQTEGISYPSMDFWRGSLALVSNNNGALAKHSLQFFLLGGFSTVTLPNSGFTENGTQQFCYQETYIPYDTLDVVTTMTATLGAGATVTVADGFQRITSLIAGSLSRYTETGAAIRDECIARAAMSTDVGRSSILLRSGDGSVGHEIEVRLGTTTLELFDVGSGAQIGGTVTTTTGTLYDVLLAVKSSTADCSVWYRERPLGLDEREWTLLGASSSLTDDGGTGTFGTTTQAIHYVPGDPVTTYECDLAELHWNMTTGGTSPTTGAGIGLAGGQVLDDLNARNYTLLSTYVHDGISIAASGITRRGDEFVITPRHTYEAENAISIPSPRVGWRSLTTTADMSLAFKFPTAQTRWSNDQIGIYLDRINFKDFEVEVRQAGVWVSLGTFNASYGVSYNTVGDCVIPIQTGANGSSRRYFYRNEMAGGTLQYPSNEVRPIVKNTSGIDNEGTPESKRVTWYLDPDSITGLEPSGPATGAQVWYPRVLVLLSLTGDTVTQGVRITIRPGGVSPAPYQGYYEIGQLCIGEIFTFGWAPDNTRSVARELADEIIEEVDGTRSISKLGKIDRRRAEISWARNSRQTEIQNAGSPNYITSTTAAGAEPVASRFGTPIEFDGFLAEHGKRPLVYMPRFGRSGSTSITLTSHYCRGTIYGRFVPDTYRVETAAGIAEQTETVRTSVVTIEEEI